jgi:hypothetical protein
LVAVRRLLRVVIRLALVMVAVRAVSGFVSRRGNVGDAGSDEFAITACLGGVERESLAASLRRGRVLACLGGVDLDLRRATLDPGGAELDLRACLGGIQVTVPGDWRVTVAGEPRAGGMDVRVTPPEELAADAPSLRVDAAALLGGVVVAAARQRGDGSTADRTESS